jgi:hypothetical protein
METKKLINKAVPITLIVCFILVTCVALIVKTDSINTIQINYSVKTGTTTGMMFGGNNYGFSFKSISDAHKKAGFNVARYDALINEIVPATTINNYKRNVLDVQDPKTWKWGRIDRDLNMLHTSGIKVLLIINYCPLWLASNEQANNKNINTIPMDWVIYEDIVKKVYQHIQSKVFAIEVWNEPDTGLKLGGSPYKDVVTAYTDLYYHTAQPIRTINSAIKIGGPAVADTYDTKFFNALLNDKRLKSLFDFYSYHFYGVQKVGNISSLKSLAAFKGRSNFPIYITEWNYSAEFNKNPMNTNAAEAISFVGNTLIDQLKESPALSILYCMDDYSKADNFFTMDANGNMVPKVSAIKLMSVSLGLGTGTNTIVKTTSSGSINGVGAINYLGKQIICLANEGENNKLVNINLYKTGITAKKTVSVYLAAKGIYGTAPYKTISVLFKNGNAAINKFEIPGHAVVGLKVN